MACQPSEVSLLVDLQTDFVHGLEIEVARVRLDDDEESTLLTYEDGDPALRRVRILERTALMPSSRRSLQVELIDRAGNVVGTVTTLIDHGGDQAILIPVARSCPVACEAGCRYADGAWECLDVEDPPPACQLDTDCGALPDADCAVLRCVGGACLAERREEFCDVDSYCVAGMGCAPIPGTYRGLALGPAIGATVSTTRPTFVWDPSALAEGEDVELEISSECDPLSFRECQFEAPEVQLSVDGGSGSHRLSTPLPVSTTPPVGMRYTWRMRGCVPAETCDADWSEPRYLDVGRLADDFNGDGFSDLVATAPGARHRDDEGQLYVLPGGPEGPGATGTVAVPYPAEGTWDYESVDSGDLNGDGFADLAVSGNEQLPSCDERGGFFVFLGGPDGLSLSPVAFDIGEDGGCHSNYGRPLFVGDFDGDGHRDVLARDSTVPLPGEPWRFTNAGFRLLRGTAEGVTLESAGVAASEPWVLVPGHDLELFHQAEVGDVDGDGYLDIVTFSRGVRGFSVESGRLERPRRLWTVPATENAPRADLALADVFGDGRWDVLARVNEDAFQLEGVPFGVGPPSPLSLPDEGFPALLRSADTDADGRAEVVGLVSEHAAGLFSPGSWSPLVETDALSAHDLALGDYDGDGLPDVVLAGDGAVLFFAGSGASPVRIEEPTPACGAESCDFGHNVH